MRSRARWPFGAWLRRSIIETVRPYHYFRTSVPVFADNDFSVEAGGLRDTLGAVVVIKVRYPDGSSRRFRCETTFWVGTSQDCGVRLAGDADLPPHVLKI